MKVGFIGVGEMGIHMASHVQEAGYRLVVHDAKKEAAAPLLAKGAEWADTPKAVAGSCQLAISCLPTPPIVEDVVLGANGLKEGWKEGDIYVDMSTNSPSTIRQIAEVAAPLGAKVLDAPVSGGTRGAEMGTLTVMVGGDASVVEEARPVLETMASKVFHLGDVGCGNVAKLANNMIGLACNCICAEAFVLAAKSGIDPQTLYDILVMSTADNWNLRQYPNTVLQGNFSIGFKTALAQKDIGLAVALSDEYGLSLPMASVVKARLAESVDAGHADYGVDAVILGLEEAAQVEVRSVRAAV